MVLLIFYVANSCIYSVPVVQVVVPVLHQLAIVVDVLSFLAVPVVASLDVLPICMVN